MIFGVRVPSRMEGPAPDFDVLVDGEWPETWAGRLLWEECIPDHSLERLRAARETEATVERVAADAEWAELYGEARQEEDRDAERPGLSVLRTTGAAAPSARLIRIPLSSLQELVLPDDWSPPRDVTVSVPWRPSTVPHLVNANTAVKSEYWRRYTRRMRTCRTPELGRLWYGRNAEEEFFDPAPCCLAWHDCREKDVARRVRALCPEGMMTLTFDPKRALTRDQAYIRAFPMMRDLFKWLKRQGVDPGRYVAVKEAHEDGRCHVHIAVERFPWGLARLKERKRRDGRVEVIQVIDTIPGPGGKPRRWRDEWVRLGGGCIVEWEALRCDGTYIAKYVTDDDAFPEQIQALLSINGARSWTSSTGLKQPREKRFWTFAVGKTPGQVGRDLHQKMARIGQKRNET